MNFTRTGTFNPFPIDIKDPSLVLYLPLWYPASNMTGSSIISYDKNKVSGTVTGALWKPKGRYFDETDDTINVTITIPSSLTILFWGRVDEAGTATATPWDDCYFRNTASSSLKFDQVNSNNRPLLEFYDGSAWHNLSYNMSTSSQKNWNCYAFTLTNGAQSIYLNSKLVTTSTYGWVAADSLRFSGPTFHPARWMGEFVMYNRILGVGEIARYYQNSKGRFI